MPVQGAIVVRTSVILVMILTSMVFSSSGFASRTTNAYGRVVCGNGEQAGGYNPNTGKSWKSERNQNGVATTQTSAGGKAKTKNGKGVYSSSSGTKNVTKPLITTAVLKCWHGADFASIGEAD